MRFAVSDEEQKQANWPHELFITNLVGNHILMFVAALGMFGSLPYLVALVPVISFAILGYTLWRAHRSKTKDSWYVMCHWQVCARRSKLFILMLSLLGGVALGGWVSYTYLGVMKEAVYALIGGMGILPVMVVVLVLIIMESEALYHANMHRLPDWVVKQHPNPAAKTITEAP